MNKVYFSESDANKYALQNTTENRPGPKYYVRSIQIKLDGDTINPVGFNCGMFEHFKLLDVLKDLEKLLSS